MIRYMLSSWSVIGLLAPIALVKSVIGAQHKRALLSASGTVSFEEDETPSSMKTNVMPDEGLCNSRDGRPSPTAPVLTVDDLESQRCNIFPSGSVAGASFKWFDFLFNRTGIAGPLTTKDFLLLNRGYCPISALAISGKHSARVTLKNAVGGGTTTGIFHFSVKECICDVKELVSVDKLNISVPEGTVELKVLVIGDPCQYPDAFDRSFLNAEAQGATNLNAMAPEVKCLPAFGGLSGAARSAHGFPIIGVLFDPHTDVSATMPPNNGDSDSMSAQCTERANEGYLTGNAHIFRRVAQINPINGPPTVS